MTIYRPTQDELFRYGGSRSSHLHHPYRDSALCGSITRGLGYRNLGGRLAAIGGAAKPYNREVAYLENTITAHNNSYLNLGIHPDQSSITTVVFNNANYLTWCVFGGYDNNNKNYGVVFSGMTMYCLLGNQSSKTVQLLDKNTLTLNANTRVITLNGIDYQLSHSLNYVSGISIYMFNDNAINGLSGYELSYPMKGKIYSFEYESSTEKMSLIPVVKTFDGVEEGCMYDKISKRFFRNAGAGAFTWGEL